MSERKATGVHGVVLDTETTFTMSEFCEVCGIGRSQIVTMVNYGLIDPIEHPDDWQFHGEALVRAQRALRLIRDLDLNWAGAALAVDLLERLEYLETHLQEPQGDRL